MQEEIQPLLPDLLFPSESDEPVAYFCMEYLDTDAPLSPERLAALLNLDPKVPILEKDPEEFWSLVTQEREWHDAFEKDRTERFKHIRSVLEAHLDPIHYFEAGEIEVKLYVLGIFEGNVRGITTTAIRT